MMFYTAALFSLGLLVAAHPLAPVEDDAIQDNTLVRLRRAAYAAPLQLVDQDGDPGSEPPISLVRIKRAAVRLDENVAKIHDQLNGAQEAQPTYFHLASKTPTLVGNNRPTFVSAAQRPIRVSRAVRPPPPDAVEEDESEPIPSVIRSKRAALRL